MKNLLYKSITLFLGLVMCTALIACGNDDDEPNVPESSKEIVSYKVTYLADVTEAYLDYYDVTWTYIDSNGVTKTEAMTEMQSFNISIPVNVMPSAVGLTIHATLKNPLPSYDREMVYKFGSSSQVLVSKIYRDNSEEIVGGNLIPDSHNVSVKGDKLTDYFQKYSDFNIVSTSVKVK